MKAIELIIGCCIVILLMSAVLAAITLFRSAEYEEPHNVTTGGGVTTADIILTQELLDNETYHVTISSNLTGDAAVPSAYTSATRTLTVGGLLAGNSRQLTVTYRYNQLNDVFWAADTISRAWPVTLGVGILGVIGAAVYVAAQRRNG